jgi:hypothetical protein
MRYIQGEGGENDPNSKLNRFIDEIIKSHKEYKKLEYTNKITGKTDPIKGAAQIVFAVQGFGDAVMANRGFNAKRYFIKRLVKGGIPANEIAFISDYKTAAAKEGLFKEMRQGTKKVLVGSPKNMGTGVNVQKRLKREHYLSPPWYPADVEQPDGRIIRQGNQNETIRLTRYATKGTYDSTGWAMNARKARSIEQAMTGDDSQRSIDDISESSLYEQASAMAAGDERAVKLASLSRDIEVLERLDQAHRNEQYNLRSKRVSVERDIQNTKTDIAKAEGAVKAVGSTYIMGKDFRITANGVTPEKRNEMGDALIAAWRKAVKENAARAIETGYGLDIEIGKAMGKHPIVLQLERYETSEFDSWKAYQQAKKEGKLEYGTRGEVVVKVGDTTTQVSDYPGY